MQDATHLARLAISFAFSSALSARTTRHAALLGMRISAAAPVVLCTSFKRTSEVSLSLLSLETLRQRKSGKQVERGEKQERERERERETKKKRERERRSRVAVRSNEGNARRAALCSRRSGLSGCGRRARCNARSGKVSRIDRHIFRCVQRAFY